MKPNKLIEINSTPIAYYDIGEGQPVVFIHGFGSYSYTWTYVLSKFPKNKRYIGIDLKGFGYSDKTNDNKFSLKESQNIYGKCNHTTPMPRPTRHSSKNL